MCKWIRKGDRVLVTAGNDKGKTGEVLSRKGDRVIVQGVNLRKKHLKRTQEVQAGRIVDVEVSIHISNVCLCDKKDQPIRRMSVKVEKNGERSLMIRSGSTETVYRSLKKPA